MSEDALFILLTYITTDDVSLLLGLSSHDDTIDLLRVCGGFLAGLRDALLTKFESMLSDSSIISYLVTCMSYSVLNFPFSR